MTPREITDTRAKAALIVDLIVGLPIDEVLRDLAAAVDWDPHSRRLLREERLFGAFAQICSLAAEEED